MCDNPRLSRLEYVPHRVYLNVTDQGTLEPTGDNEQLDASWDETQEFWCHGCNTPIDGEDLALEHAGVDPEGV